MKTTFVLLVGVLLTYGVAWTLAVGASWRGGWRMQIAIIYDASQVWLWPPPAHWPGANAGSTSTAFACEYVKVSYVDAPPLHAMRVAQKTQHRHRIGWPLLALESRQAAELLQVDASIIMSPVSGSKYVWLESLEGGLNMRGGGPQGYINLPIVPRWPHFAANVALYSLFTWSVLFLPGSVRRLHRRRHNRCVRCGYLLDGLAACPECGQV
jgi:hypothetical protein